MKHALKKSKFIVLYVESLSADGKNRDFRRTLADNTIGALVNEQVMLLSSAINYHV